MREPLDTVGQLQPHLPVNSMLCHGQVFSQPNPPPLEAGTLVAMTAVSL